MFRWYFVLGWSCRFVVLVSYTDTIYQDSDENG